MHKEILARPGEQISHVYFPTRGAISLITHMNDATGVETATTGRDGCVGVSVLFDDTTCLQDWLVQMPGEAQRMRVDDFQRAVQVSESLRRLVGRYTIALLNQTARGSACNRRHRVEQRLARWLLMIHDLADGDELSADTRNSGPDARRAASEREPDRRSAATSEVDRLSAWVDHGVGSRWTGAGGLRRLQTFARRIRAPVGPIMYGSHGRGQGPEMTFDPPTRDALCAPWDATPSDTPRSDRDGIGGTVMVIGPRIVMSVES